MTETQTINLDRKFVSIASDDDERRSVEAELAVAQYRGEEQGWPELLKHQYVVVLGEAGTGKTREFRRQADLLGEPAFFLELCDLAGGLDGAMDAPNLARLEAWRVDSEDGYFFLDSLDEAKLARNTLQQALRKLQNSLKCEWSRVRLVISCRVSDWATNDRNVVHSIAQKDSDGNSDIHLVQFVGLDEKRVKQLAGQEGVADVDGFWAAILSQELKAIVERPLDVVWLASFWSAQSPPRLGTLTELLTHYVAKNLGEWSERSAQVADTQIREGMETLAGVATIAGKVSFLVPGASADRNSLNLATTLPNWSVDHQKELLARGVFDPSTFGRVRFHHRDVQDFLAAKWLKQLLDNGVPHKKVEALLIRKTSNAEAIPVNLRNVTAWLCQTDPRLFKRVVELEPEILLSFGDATEFSDEQRRRVLLAYAKEFDDRERRWDSFGGANLMRFASEGLVPTIDELLSSASTRPEMKRHLLRMVRFAGLRTMRTRVLGLALDDSEHVWVRAAAIEALAVIGTVGDRVRLVALLREPTVWDHELAAAFLSTLYPNVLGVSGLLTLLNQVKRGERNSTSSFDVHLPEAMKAGDESQRLELLRGWRAMFGQTPNINVARVWQAPALAVLVEEVIRDSEATSEPVDPIVFQVLELLRWCEQHPSSSWHLHGTALISKKYPGFRRAWFWWRVAEFERKEGKRPRAWEVGMDDWTRFDETDVVWLSKDAKDSTRKPWQRALAFNVIIRGLPQSPGRLKRLETIASGYRWLEVRLARARNSGWVHIRGEQAEEHRRSADTHAKYALKRRWWDLKKRRKHQKERKILDERIEFLRDASDLSNLRMLLTRNGRSNANDVGKVETVFGRDIAQAAETGWRTFWRTYGPPLLHEKPRDTVGVKLGLAGLEAEFRGGTGAFSSINAERAARYATRAMNSLPTWLDRLAATNASDVQRALEPSIRAEFFAQKTVHGVLSKLARCGPCVQALCGPLVARLLNGEAVYSAASRARPPGVRRTILRNRGRSRSRAARCKWVVISRHPTIEAITDSISFLLAANMSETIYSDTIRREARRSVDEPKRFAIWWCLWLEREGDEAVAFLAALVGRRTKAAGKVLVETCAARIRQYTEPGYDLPALRIDGLNALRDLVLLVFEYVPTETDPEHTDSYSPDRRDHAQEGRRFLQNRLQAFEGEAATLAMLEVANDPRMKNQRDWWLRMVDDRIASDAGMMKCPVADEIIGIYREHGTEAMNLIGAQMTERVDVVILTMKEEEYAAVLKSLGSTAARKEQRTYEVTEVQTPKGICRVAVTRLTSQGNVASGTAASEADTDLSAAYMLVVGIAGTSPNSDVTLGDVVVSTYIHDFTIQDTGHDDDPKFSVKGGAVDTQVDGIASNLAGIERRAGSWMPNTQRPTSEASYTTDDDEWNAKVKAALARSAQKTTPTARAGKIASSDLLVKKPKLIKQWESGAKGFQAIEMESAGVYEYCYRHSIPMLAIRGISDIVGAKRDGKWTQYACDSAAAYTLMLIKQGEFIGSR